MKATVIGPRAVQVSVASSTRRDPSAYRDRPVLYGWLRWSEVVRSQVPLEPAAASVLASVRADLLAGRPVDPEMLLWIGGLNEGLGWMAAGAVLGRRPAPVPAAIRPTIPARAATPLPGRIFRYGVWVA